MNTRRQTVWLVSMLGLMVVLSAYYLFTDEADQVAMQAEEQPSGGEIIVDGVGLMDPTAAEHATHLGAAVTGEEEASETSAEAEPKATGEADANEQVLESIAN